MKEKKIDKNIPVSRKGHGQNKYPFIPWDSLEIGDSFNCSTDKEFGSAITRSYRYGKSAGKKFTIRRNRSANGKIIPGGRIWRIE